MPVKEIGDPRLQALFGASDPREGGVRPTVRLPRKGLPPAALAGIALFLAILLFMILNARRTQQGEPAVQAQASDNPGSAWSEPPSLYVPPVQAPVAVPAPVEQASPAPVAQPTPAPATRAPVGQVAPLVQPVPMVAPAPPPPAPQRISSGSPLVIDTGAAGSPSAAPTTGTKEPETSSTTPIARMRASAFANRSTTVPQGYLIPAVLETGFDSTKPGYARAIVSRDVRGFDGKNILIPRGSRLIGEYKSAVGQSQNRAIITWTRLIRPDGMTITMESPAVDTVGRGGVPASVNTHFFARLGDALLQSTFQIGQLLGGRAITGQVVVLAGNATTAATQTVAPAVNYVPTLKVPPGKSISIFVAQDLDFTGAGVGR